MKLIFSSVVAGLEARAVFLLGKMENVSFLIIYFSPKSHDFFNFNFTITFITLIIFSRRECALEKGFAGIAKESEETSQSA